MRLKHEAKLKMTEMIQPFDVMNEFSQLPGEFDAYFVNSQERI